MGKYLGQARTPLEGVALVHVELGRPATFDAHTVGVHAFGMDTFVMLTIDTFSAVHTAMPTDQHTLVVETIGKMNKCGSRSIGGRVTKWRKNGSVRRVVQQWA